MSSCRYPFPVVPDSAQSAKTADSIAHLLKRHYTLNANFKVTADSLMLHQLPLIDSLPIYRNDEIVVAEFMSQPDNEQDSVWVKVARDQSTMGWLPENELLRNIVPIDPISQFIHFFSNIHTIAFLIIFSIFIIWYLVRAFQKKRIHIAWLNDVDIMFPATFSLLIATSATLYSSIQHFVPETWQQFYYDPSLNPFRLPFILALFMINVWLVIIVGLATLEVLFKQKHLHTTFFYLLGLTSYCIILYIFFTVATYYYLGYVCLPIYIWWCIKRLRNSTSYRYRCGNCGLELRRKGICPHCGAVNE